MGMLRATLAVRRLPAADRRLAAAAAFELTRSSVELRVYPRDRTVGLLGVSGDRETDDPVAAAQLREAERLGAMVERVAARLPWRPTCLRQAIAVQRMLRRRGIPSRLHLGVTNPTEGAAHAWVTVGGQPVVGGRGIERFVPLAAFG
jgi:hypothetical protein